MPQQALEQFTKTINAIPTPDLPSPVDVALSLVPAAMPVENLFKGISAQAIMAAPTMGNPLKDVINVTLKDVRDVAPPWTAPVISTVGKVWSSLWD